MAGKKTAAKPDVSAFLLGNAAAPKKAGKKEHPELKDSGALADATYAAYKAVKDAEAHFRALEGQLLEIVTPEYQSRVKSDFQGTFNIAGEETPGVQISFKDAFKKIPIERQAELQEILGDHFGDFYFQKRDLSLTDTSDETITMLMEKLGDDTFRAVFKIDLSVGTVPGMDRKQFELPEEARPEQYKGALKIRK